MGRLASEIVNNSGDLGRVANMRLRDAISTRSPGMSAAAISAEVENIGVEIMILHMNLVNSTGGTEATAVAAYHHQVFRNHSLPNNTFGGTMFTGSEAEAWFTSKLPILGWLDCR
jgi:hypothetical protein